AVLNKAGFGGPSSSSSSSSSSMVGGVQRVPAEKVWLHVHKPSRTRPAGESILEPAFRAWSAKDRLLQFWGQAIQRFGSPQWVVKIPANTAPARQQRLLDA